MPLSDGKVVTGAQGAASKDLPLNYQRRTRQKRVNRSEPLMSMAGPRGGPRLLWHIKPKRPPAIATAAKTPSVTKAASQRGRSTTPADTGQDSDNPLSHCA